jgi:hypothetical protein
VAADETGSPCNQTSHISIQYNQLFDCNDLHR